MALKLPDFADYTPQLDLEAVAQAILQVRDGGRPMKSDDFENAKQVIYSAAEQWFPRDVRELSVTAVEELAYLELPGISPTKMFMDLEGTTRGLIKPFSDYPGAKIIFDWKTRDGGLDQRWKDRYVDSWQWRIYAAKAQATLFVYRGISRKFDFTENRCDTREIIIRVPETNSQEVHDYLRAAQAERTALITLGATVWPRNWDACNDYGRECPFYTDCVENTMPEFTPVERPMSYSRWHTFFQCHERHRRLEAKEMDSLEEDETAFGVAAHRGLAALWSQITTVKELQ